MNQIKFCFAALFLLIFISSCSIPQITPVSSFRHNAIACGCRGIFPDHRMQFIHSLTAILPNGDTHVAIGVTTVDPDMETIHCAIMTIEGLVLFDAEYNQKIVINRSIPPFDSPAFARNIVNDIRLVYFKPDGIPVEAGSLTSESNICRYKNPDGITEDVITYGNGNWEIHQYNQYQKEIKTVNAFFTDTEVHRNQGKANPIPSMIEITTPGIFGYSLKLELLEVRQNPL